MWCPWACERHDRQRESVARGRNIELGIDAKATAVEGRKLAVSRVKVAEVKGRKIAALRVKVAEVEARKLAEVKGRKEAGGVKGKKMAEVKGRNLAALRTLLSTLETRQRATPSPSAAGTVVGGRGWAVRAGGAVSVTECCRAR
jgi:predicted RNA-binding protein YlqC (UPF0109 family)